MKEKENMKRKLKPKAPEQYQTSMRIKYNFGNDKKN